jgi:hypothetical protein
VFEEIVRSKVKERRDADDRLRLRRQVETLLPQISASAKKIAANTTTYFPNTVAMYTLGTAKKLQKDLADLSTAYNGITTPQWAIVGSIPDRSAMDGFLNATGSAITTALSCFEGDDDADHMTEPDGVSLLDTLKAIRDAVTAFAAQMDAVHARLFPALT